MTKDIENEIQSWIAVRSFAVEDANPQRPIIDANELAEFVAGVFKKLEGCVVVPRGVLDLTRFMCKTWSEIDKFVYKNCTDIGQYPVIQGTQNQLDLSRIGEQQINENEINKGVKWLLEAARGGNE